MSDLNVKHRQIIAKAAAVVRARGHEGDARLADSLHGILASLASADEVRRAPAAAPAAYKKVGHFLYEGIAYVATSSDDPRGIPLYREVEAGIAAAPAPVAASENALMLSDVIEAIRVVDKEAARRGEMYPQHAEEQREDRAAVRNVVAKLLFYGGLGCETWPEWPKFAAAPQAPAAAPIVQPVAGYLCPNDPDQASAFRWQQSACKCGAMPVPLYRAAPTPASSTADAKDAATWRGILEALMRELPKRGHDARNGNAPGHCHEKPGIWDGDNGVLAGKECAWCKVWNEARAAIASSAGEVKP